jgi:hypothetical protein
MANLGMLRTRTFAALREPIQVLSKLVGIPLICLTALFLAALYLLGGTDLLRFALKQLTWKVSFKIVAGLALFTWIRHVAWYHDEPPPLWWWRSTWLNLLEILVLLALIFLAIWAIPRFA